MNQNECEITLSAVTQAFNAVVFGATGATGKVETQFLTSNCN